MYKYLFFSISLLSLFSILENIKGKQHVSYFKTHILAILACMSIGSFLYFLDEVGFSVDFAIGLIRVVSTIFFVNIFYVLAQNRVPKKVIYVEIFLLLAYVLFLLNGFVFISIKNGIYNKKPGLLHLINFGVTYLLMISSIILNFIKLRSKIDKNNLYHLRLFNWSNYLLLLIISILLISAYNIFSVLNIHAIFKGDTRIMHLIIYTLLIVFFLFRPRFIDEFDFSYSQGLFSSSKPQLLKKDFEYLFYSNLYFLRPDANLDDFSIKLNVEKSTVAAFIQTQIGESFLNLVNRNRIKYFRALLDERKFETFTIEALSEMSGFNNRQSMYNAFKKFMGCTPSSYIEGLK
jgi:AraC-like DNA-binding protein